MRIAFTARLTGAGVVGLVLSFLAACKAQRGESSGATETAASTSPAIASAAKAATQPLVTVYKNPTCRCCAEWADHLRANGFRVDIREDANLVRVRAERGVPADLASCHTAVVGDYTIEGHVPADVIRKLLQERPGIAGLAVPGMPAGVPGMPNPGPNRDPYQIFAFDRDGTRRVYATR